MRCAMRLSVAYAHRPHQTNPQNQQRFNMLCDVCKYLCKHYVLYVYYYTHVLNAIFRVQVDIQPMNTSVVN